MFVLAHSRLVTCTLRSPRTHGSLALAVTRQLPGTARAFIHLRVPWLLKGPAINATARASAPHGHAARGYRGKLIRPVASSSSSVHQRHWHSRLSFLGYSGIGWSGPELWATSFESALKLRWPRMQAAHRTPHMAFEARMCSVARRLCKARALQTRTLKNDLELTMTCCFANVALPISSSKLSSYFPRRPSKSESKMSS